MSIIRTRSVSEGPTAFPSRTRRVGIRCAQPEREALYPWSADSTGVFAHMNAYGVNRVIDGTSNTITSASNRVCLDASGGLSVYAPLPFGGMFPVFATSKPASSLSLTDGTLATHDASGHPNWTASVGDPGNAVSGGGFSYVFDKSAGDSKFGAETWFVAGATNANAIQNPPNQQAANTPPTISQISSPQTAITGVPSSPLGFSVDDAESDPATSRTQTRERDDRRHYSYRQHPQS